MTTAMEKHPLRAGVIGWPIGHSLSPIIHRYWLDYFGIEGRYEPVPVAPEDLETSVLHLIREDGWRGMNVTVPHKEAVVSLCDHVDEMAERLGAVNTLAVGPDGRIEGRNTDLYGFRRNLETAADWPNTGRDSAVVLGAGGAARAVVGALRELGFQRVDIVNRTKSKAEGLAALFGPGTFAADFNDLSDLLSGADLLVNTTALGMKGQPPLDIDLEPLPVTALVTDIVYNPLKTGILAAAEARGNPTVDGLGMLLHQAVPGFCAWFSPKETPTVTPELRAAVLKAMADTP